MEVGDENLPPSGQSWTSNPVCNSPRSPGAASRSVLGDMNTSVQGEAKTRNNDSGSGTTEEEKCQAAATDQEAEAWSERTAVITRYDHETNCHLARGFVEDLADKVVAEKWKEPAAKPEGKPEGLKPPTSLNLKKQLLFLPDLVPNVVVSQPSAPTSTDTVSESDEYESADEQPHFHVNPIVTSVNASTPIDCPGWHLDFDSSHVLPVGDVTVDASLKDYSLPVIDRVPESTSDFPSEVNEDDIPVDEETDELGVIKKFPQVARSTQHQSPSSGSDVEVSVVESESDTLAAVTPNNPTSEVDVDLIKQFERLVLNKQAASQKSPVTPTLNTTFPLEENTPVACVNETALSVNDYEDLIPADATRDVLSETRDISTTNNNPEDESELATPFHDLDQSSFVDIRPTKETEKPSVLEESASSKSLAEEPKVQQEEEPVAQAENDTQLPSQEEAPVPEEASETVEKTEAAPIEGSAVEEVKEELAQDTEVPKTQDSEEPAAQELVEQTAQEAPEPTVDQDTVGPSVEGVVLEEDSEQKQHSEEPSKDSPEAAVEKLSVAVTELELAAEPTTSIEDGRPITVTEATTSSVEEPVTAAVEEPSTPTLQAEPAEIISNEVDVPAEDESTVLSAAEQTVLNAADKSASVVEVVETAAEVSPVIEDVPAESPITDSESIKVKPTSLPEEKPIVPKKGYDLSFLDRFDDLENATPSISQAKLVFSATPSSESALKAIEEKPDPSPAAVDDQQVDVDESACVNPRLDADQPTLDVTTSCESAVQEETVVEDKSEDCVEKPEVEKETLEEPVIIPKKGYNLDFLDKLDDLENASPTVNGPQEPAMKESMSTHEKTGEPADEQPSLEAKSEKTAENGSPTKKAPVVRKPIRPRIARPTTTAKKDPFEVEFTFDPNEDPFKSKKKLDASPTRDTSDTSSLPQSEINTTIDADRVEANDTVTESIPESDSQSGAIAERLANEETDQEEFRPAQEVFHDPSELDFLMQHGGSSNDIALARQSLFVKFDPLVTGRPSMFPTRASDGAADETILADDQTAARKSAGESLFLFSPPHPSSGGTSKSEKSESVEKANPECLMSSRNVTGDVLSVSEHKEALKLQELLFQDKLLQKEREILAREKESQELKSKLEATAEAQVQMRQIVGEYEKTISQLIAEKEREKANMETTLQNTIKERDQAIEDLKEVERAFSEFHRMYERNRAAAENLHKNEEALKKALTAYQERLQQEQHKYETLKLHAAQKLEGAQQEMENLKRNLEAESSRVKAQLKKTEMRLASVETSLEQKTKENEELTTLCDELINKLGSSAK